MERVAVVSSNVAAIAHDEQTQTLEVKFKANRVGISPVWRYTPVSRDVYESMLDEGASVGGILAIVKTAPGVQAYKAAEEPAEVSA